MIFVTAILVGFLSQTNEAARVFAVGPTRVTIQLESGRVKGEPSRLAWSPDGTTLYLQTAERTHGTVVVRHFLIAIAEGTPRSIDGEPPWAALYWDWKSAQTSPALATFKIDVEQSERVARPTASPAGGDLARGGGGNPLETASIDDAMSAHAQGQKQSVFTLRAAGTTIGEWVNVPVVPGATFGWAPSPSRVLAFTPPDGGPIVLLDAAGHRQELPDTGTAMLPGWSQDGTQLAWVQRTDRKHRQIRVAPISLK